MCDQQCPLLLLPHYDRGVIVWSRHRSPCDETAIQVVDRTIFGAAFRISCIVAIHRCGLDLFPFLQIDGIPIDGQYLCDHFRCGLWSRDVEECTLYRTEIGCEEPSDGIFEIADGHSSDDVYFCSDHGDIRMDGVWGIVPRSNVLVLQRGIVENPPIPRNGFHLIHLSTGTAFIEISVYFGFLNDGAAVRGPQRRGFRSQWNDH